MCYLMKTVEYTSTVGMWLDICQVNQAPTVQLVRQVWNKVTVVIWVMCGILVVLCVLNVLLVGSFYLRSSKFVLVQFLCVHPCVTCWCVLCVQCVVGQGATVRCCTVTLVLACTLGVCAW